MRKGQKIVAFAIERLAGDFVAERSVTVFPLPNDEMKGKIIGREGRNIRALEAATGIDLIVDDTPEAVVISCHNPIRREIAQAVAGELGLRRPYPSGTHRGGRAQGRAGARRGDSARPARRRSSTSACTAFIPRSSSCSAGSSTATATRRTSAAFDRGGVHLRRDGGGAGTEREAGAARRAAARHRQGAWTTRSRARTRSSAPNSRASTASRRRSSTPSPRITKTCKAETILAPLVDAADALSGARPGARREMMESYTRRLEELERIVNEFKGVEKSFAVQAGREIRIIVQHDIVSDDEASRMAREVARKIENEMTYPGQIKVTVIREMRAVDFAVKGMMDSEWLS